MVNEKRKRKENVTELAYINDSISRRVALPVVALNIKRAEEAGGIGNSPVSACLFCCMYVLHVPH